MSALVPSSRSAAPNTFSKLSRSRLASAAAVLGAALMMAPPPATADRDDWEDGDHHGYYERYDGHRHKHSKRRKHHEHGEWCAPRRYARPPVVYAYEPYHYAPPRPRRYYCDPCDHWYGTEASFHYHVHHHHHVARALLPAVIAATVFGAIYAGY